jgi:2-polyprenyl-3-methyl-5-hydroxy-6-metoxy-1,4-benzoquinol methylase
MSDFDVVASTYQDLISESVRISGEHADYFAAYKAFYLKRILAGLKIQRILDYGCGVGSLAKHLRAQFPVARIDGFDPSHESLQKVEDSLRRRGSYVSSLRDVAGGYDLIVLANVLHHLRPDERATVLNDVFPRLMPGGQLAVFEHNPYNPLTQWAASRCEFDADAVLLSGKETRARLRVAGFNIHRQDFVVFFPRWLSFLRPLEPSLKWCPAGAQYAVLAERAAKCSKKKQKGSR